MTSRFLIDIMLLIYLIKFSTDSFIYRRSHQLPPFFLQSWRFWFRSQGFFLWGTHKNRTFPILHATVIDWTMWSIIHIRLMHGFHFCIIITCIVLCRVWKSRRTIFCRWMKKVSCCVFVYFHFHFLSILSSFFLSLTVDVDQSTIISSC